MMAGLCEGDDADSAPEAMALDELVGTAAVDETLLEEDGTQSTGAASTMLNSSLVANTFPSPTVPFGLETRNLSENPVPVGNRVPTSSASGKHDATIVVESIRTGTGSAKTPSAVITADGVKDVLPFCESCNSKN